MSVDNQDAFVGHESQARSRAILDALPDLMFHITQAGEILDYNAPDKAQLFAPEDQIIGGNIKDLMPPDFSTECTKKIEDALAFGRLQVWEYDLQFPDGQQSFEARFMPLEENEVVVIVRDITENRRSQEAIRQAETMIAMGELVGSVAHEVRNPLFSLSATLDAFEARFGDEPAYQKYFAVFREGMDRLSFLMRDLLEYGRPRSSDLQPHPLGEALLEASKENRSHAEEAGVHLELEIEDCENVGVAMDRNRIVRVFHNLLQNGIQHCSEGGVVKLVGTIINAGADREMAQLVVSDHGSGFTDDDLARAFEPFYTSRRGGIGLGLAIVKRIVDEHGGNVTVANGAQGGAILTVRLPIAQSNAGSLEITE